MIIEQRIARIIQVFPATHGTHVSGRKASAPSGGLRVVAGGKKAP